MKHTILTLVGRPGRLASRSALVASALRLSYFTIAWNGVVGATALVVSTVSHSLALAGFALNALLDSSASAVLVWRFHRERTDPAAAERLERHAQAFIAVAMLAVALYVGFESVRALIDGSQADESALGIGRWRSLRFSSCRGLARGSCKSPRPYRAERFAAMAFSALRPLGLRRSPSWRCLRPERWDGGGPIHSPL